MKHLFRRLSLAFAVVVFALVGVLYTLDTQSAAASSCGSDGSGNNWHVGGIVHGLGYGGQGRAPEKNYIVADVSSGGFVIHRDLVVIGEDDSNYWAEIGFGRGWHGENIAHFYYARSHPSLGYDEFKLTKTPGGAGTYHTYEITVNSMPDGTGSVNAKIDGTNYATTNGFNHAYSKWIEFLGEATDGNNSTVPETPVTDLKYRSSSGSWISWPNNTSVTICVADSPLQWSWTSYPTAGKFWK